MRRRITWLILSGVFLLAFVGILYGADSYNRAFQIPRLYIHGDLSKMKDKTDVERVSVEYRDENQRFTAYAKLKIQGTSSIYYNKKNYTIKFYDSTFSRRENVDLGWGGQSKYCLKANWIDKTHARNLVTAQLATEMQRKYGILEQAPRNGLVEGYPIEVFANGKFHGLYTMNMPKDAWSFGMDEANKDHLVFCGRLWEDANFFEAMPDYGTWSIEVGEPTDENLEKLNRLFRFVMDSSDEEFKQHFGEYLDLKAAFNYIVLCDLAQMEDNFGKNILLVTYDGSLWYPTLYDMDTTWGMEYNGRELYNYTDVATADKNRLFRRIRENFGQELSQHYFELREDILTREHIMESFYAFAEQIPQQSLDREKARWGTPPGFDYDQIEAFLDVRLPLLDEYMAALRA